MKLSRRRGRRAEYAAQFNYDLDEIYADLKRQEQQSKRQVVSLPPRAPELLPQAQAS